MSDPFPHQIAGVPHLAGQNRALLADEPRCGKTVTTILAAQETGARRILVICPGIARAVWSSHIAEWDTDSVTTIRRGEQLKMAGGAKWTVVSYNLARTPRGVALIHRLNPEIVIFDECHALKEPTTLTVKQLMPYNLIDRASHVWFLSGTPAPNNASELWTILSRSRRQKMQEQGVFGYYQWRNATCIVEQKHLRVWSRRQHKHILTTVDKIVGNNPDAAPLINYMLDGFMLRRRFKDIIADAPHLTWQHHVLDMSIRNLARDIDVPEHIAEMLVRRFEGDSLSQDEASELDSYEEAVASARRKIGLAKVDAAVEYIQEEYASEKVVLFAWHTDVIKALAAKLGCKAIYGATSSTADEQALAQFTGDPSCQYIVGQIIAAGVSIDLSAARRLVFCEIDWTPGNNYQAALRISGLRQTAKDLTVDILSAPLPLDRHVNEIQQRKARDVAAMMGDQT